MACTFTGVCDESTWTALVEASYRLGDRLLVLSAPNMRGDDVADLQSVLARLGFDCGRVDGILGPTTARAVADFQRNCGLTPDGVCGAETVRALDVLGRQSGSGPGVAALREFEALSGSCRRLGDLRVVIGQFGGMSSLDPSGHARLRQRGRPSPRPTSPTRRPRPPRPTASRPPSTSASKPAPRPWRPFATTRCRRSNRRAGDPSPLGS